MGAIIRKESEVYLVGGKLKFNWDVNVGTIIAIITFLVSLYTFHISNVRRYERIETKLNILFEWFQNNVVGRGEPPRIKRTGRDE
jgi:hypothetical protein